jgi:hypothetical protein
MTYQGKKVVEVLDAHEGLNLIAIKVEGTRRGLLVQGTEIDFDEPAESDDLQAAIREAKSNYDPDNPGWFIFKMVDPEDEEYEDDEDEEIDPLADWYLLTPNQALFVNDALDEGRRVRPYSGRGMFGKRCPAIEVEDLTEFKSRSEFTYDSMGLDYVLYAPH